MTFNPHLDELLQDTVVGTNITLTHLSCSFVLGDCTGGGITVTLPPAVSTKDKVFLVKKIDSSTNTIVIDANGAETIDGLTTYTIVNQYDWVSLQSNEVGGWNIFSKPFNIIGLGIVIDGSGSTITTGISGDLIIPFNCVIQSVTLLADQSGSIVIDIWKDTLGNYPPTDSVSITASTPPTITSDTDSQNTTLSSWTKTISANDTLRFNVDSVTSITRCTLILKVKKT